jgi:hypothetical protein
MGCWALVLSVLEENRREAEVLGIGSVVLIILSISQFPQFLLFRIIAVKQGKNKGV